MLSGIERITLTSGRRSGLLRRGVRLENNYFTEMCRGSEAGSYLGCVYHSTLGLSNKEEEKKTTLTSGRKSGLLGTGVYTEPGRGSALQPCVLRAHSLSHTLAYTHTPSLALALAATSGTRHYCKPTWQVSVISRHACDRNASQIFLLLL